VLTTVFEQTGEIIMAKDLNLQDVFLNQARKEKIPVIIYITNGFQFKGLVKGFDNYTVILDTEGKQNLIYKHAISTICPSKAIAVFELFEAQPDIAEN
jgi:host factor-I protein